MRRVKKEPEKLREMLKRFEPGEEFHRFRDTAVYNSLKYNYKIERRRDWPDKAGSGRRKRMRD